VTADGSAALERFGRSHEGEARGAPNLRANISTVVSKNLFAAIDVQGGLASLHSGVSCPKSASFGTKQTVTYKGEASADLTCRSSDPRLRAIAEAVRAVVGELWVHLPQPDCGFVERLCRPDDR
jgi:hypothetical protein